MLDLSHDYEQIMASRTPLGVVEEVVCQHLMGDKSYPIEFGPTSDTPWVVATLRNVFRYVGVAGHGDDMEIYIVDRSVLWDADLNLLDSSPQSVCYKLLQRSRFTRNDLLTDMVKSKSERLQATAKWLVQACHFAGRAAPVVESTNPADKLELSPLTNGFAVGYTLEQMIHGVVVDAGHLGRYQLQWRSQRDILFGEDGEGLRFSKVADDTALTPSVRVAHHPFHVGGLIASRWADGIQSFGTGQVYPFMQYMRSDDYVETYFISEQGVVFVEVCK